MEVERLSRIGDRRPESDQSQQHDSTIQTFFVLPRRALEIPHWNLERAGRDTVSA